MSEENEAEVVVTATEDDCSGKLSEENDATELATVIVNTSNLVLQSPSELPENINIGESCEKNSELNSCSSDDELFLKEAREKEKRRRKKKRRRKRRKRKRLAHAILVEKPVVGG